MNQILSNFRFFADAQLDHLRGRVHPDKYSGAQKTAVEVTRIMRFFGEASEKAKSNNHLSGSGQIAEIEKAAKVAYPNFLQSITKTPCNEGFS